MSRWSAGPVPFLMPGVFLEQDRRGFVTPSFALHSGQQRPALIGWSASPFRMPGSIRSLACCRGSDRLALSTVRADLAGRYGRVTFP